MTNPLCHIVLEEIKLGSIEVYNVNDNRCRYHRLSSKGRSVQIIEQGMCPLAYAYIYPNLFALHCNQDRSKLRLYSEQNIKQCPLGRDGISFNIYIEKVKLTPFTFAKNTISRIINMAIPFEIHDKIITIEVLDYGRGCPLGLKKGNRYSFNVARTNELCPAAFNSVYPFIDFTQDNKLVGCPDYRTHVQFTINSKTKYNDFSKQRDCDSYKARLKIINVKGSFVIPIQNDRWYTIDELISITGIRCYSSFHVALPYLYALYNGGQLGYLTHNRKKAGICCPNAALAVRYMVSKDDNAKYIYECTQTSTECPRKLLLNERIQLNNFENALPFYLGINDLYTILKKMHYYKDKSKFQRQELSTRDGDRELLWLIEY